MISAMEKNKTSKGDKELNVCCHLGHGSHRRFHREDDIESNAEGDEGAGNANARRN